MSIGADSTRSGWSVVPLDNKREIMLSHHLAAKHPDANERSCQTCGATFRPGPQGIEWKGDGSLLCNNGQG